MERKRNHCHSSRNIKAIALKATAAAVLALSAGGVEAGVCPLVISSALAGICDFTTNSSVTDANGGSVGGILMVGYVPTSPSYITVESGGLINSTGIGIEVSSSTLSDGITNSGTINAQNTGIYVTNHSTVSGDILNSGLITSLSNYGIYVLHSTVNGNVTNSGTISAKSTGLYVSSSTVTGSVTNSGMITSFDTGLNVSHSTVSGAVTNSGVITSTNDTGFAITSSTVSGGIVNSGTINAYDSGFVVKGSTVTGGITNSGTINSNNSHSSSSIGLFILGGTVTGDIINSGTINADLIGLAVGDAIVNGDVINSGTINAKGAGVYVIFETVTGNIINSGKINANLYGYVLTIATVSGDFNNTGAINSTHTGLYLDDAQISGGIINRGTINADQTGVRIDSNSTVTGGITNSGIIQGGVNAINVSSNSTVSNLEIIEQSSRIIGNVLATNTTVNIAANARFTSEGRFDVAEFNVGSGALFNMANSITSPLFYNYGTLGIANGSQQTITGEYIQESTGTLLVGATSTASYGQLVASTADLSAIGNFSVYIDPNSSIKNGDVLQDVFSAPTLVGSASGEYCATVVNSFVWQGTAYTNATMNGVDFQFNINPVAYNACGGTYCAKADEVIIEQIAAGNMYFSPFATVLTQAGFVTAVEQSTPELINEAIKAKRLNIQAVLDIFPMWSSLKGKSSGEAMIYQPGKVWLKPYGSSITQNQRTTVPGYHATAYGLVGGIDKQITDDWMLGGAFAVGNDSVRGKAALSGQSLSSDSYQGVLYATNTLPNNIYFAAQGLLGYGHNTSERVLPLFGSTAKGTYGSWFTNLSAELGRSYAVSERLLLTPTLDASYLYINQNGFSENGSIMDLNVQSNSNNSLLVGIDANAAYRAATLRTQQDLTITAHAGVAYDVLNNQPSTIATFVAGGPGFSTYGIQYNDAVFRGGVGMSIADQTKPLSVNLNYDLQAGNNGYNGIFSATLKYKV